MSEKVKYELPGDEGDASPALPRKRAEDVPVRAGYRAHLGFRLVSAAPLPYSSPAFPAGLRSTSV